jgi:ABC-type amino acid transport substrate-binding protein
MGSGTTWTRRQFLRTTLLVGGLPAMGGCGALGFGDTLQRIRDEGVIRLGIAGERPYAYLEGGPLVGATAAVHRAVFRRLGDIEVEGVQTGFGGLINALNAGTVDAVAAGMQPPATVVAPHRAKPRSTRPPRRSPRTSCGEYYRQPTTLSRRESPSRDPRRGLGRASCRK